MHSTGTFIRDQRAFSENNWGHRTAVYAKLAGDMTPSQWDSFYAGLGYAGHISDKLKECSQPVQNWTDDPDEYRIIGSDPVEEDEVMDEGHEHEHRQDGEDQEDQDEEDQEDQEQEDQEQGEEDQDEEDQEDQDAEQGDEE